MEEEEEEQEEEEEEEGWTITTAKETTGNLIKPFPPPHPCGCLMNSPLTG